MTTSMPNSTTGTEYPSADSIVIDNNSLISIVNSIITSGLSGANGLQSESTTATKPAETSTTDKTGELSPQLQPQPQPPNQFNQSNNQNQNQDQDGVQQYVLPVDLLLTVDKSNKATVSYRPATFSVQQSPMPSMPSMPSMPAMPSLHGMFSPSYPTTTTLTRQPYNPNYNAAAAYPSFATYPSYPNPYASYTMPSFPVMPQQVNQYPAQYPLSSVPLSLMNPFAMAMPSMAMPSMPLPSMPMPSMPMPSVPMPSVLPSLAAATFKSIAPPSVPTPANDGNPTGATHPNAIAQQQEAAEEKLEANEVHDAWCALDEESCDETDEPPLPHDPNGHVSSYLHVAAQLQQNSYAPHVVPPRHMRFQPRANSQVRHAHAGARVSMARPRKAQRLVVEFLRHVTMPNRQCYAAASVYTKTWALKNTGVCEWGNGVELVYVKGDEHLCSSKCYPVMNVMPGQEVHISATINTPPQPGRYCTYFRLSKGGRLFGPRVWVDVIVTENTVVPQQCRQQNAADKQDAHSHVKAIQCQ